MCPKITAVRQKHCICRDARFCVSTNTIGRFIPTRQRRIRYPRRDARFCVSTARLITNHKYLSTYINTYKQQTFRKWISELRIEEAKIILLQEPEITLAEIAHRTGYADKSHFLRHFREQTGVSPTEWRKLIQKQKFPVLTPEQP